MLLDRACFVFAAADQVVAGEMGAEGFRAELLESGVVLNVTLISRMPQDGAKSAGVVQPHFLVVVQAEDEMVVFSFRGSGFADADAA